MLSTSNIVAAFLSGAIATSAYPAGAQEFEMSLFGYQVRIEQGEPERRLLIDDVEMVRAYYVSIDEIALLDGVPVLIGDTSAGGNACDAAPFVVSFPANGRPRLDGPLDTCSGVGHEVSGSTIIFSTSALAGRNGEQWIWTAESGLRKGQDIPFVSDPAKGWAELRERTATHPSDLFNYGEIASQIRDLAGPGNDFVMRVLNGVGSGNFEGDWFTGQSCAPHMCGEEEALVVASLAERTVYLAWKPMDEKIVVRPPVGEWPERAKRELRNWAEKWK